MSTIMNNWTLDDFGEDCWNCSSSNVTNSSASSNNTIDSSSSSSSFDDLIFIGLTSAILGLLILVTIIGKFFYLTK